MGKYPTTWHLITRSCGHDEAVRVAGPHEHRSGIIATLRAERCSPCAMWPTRAVDARLIRHDLRSAHAEEPVTLH